LAAVLFASPFFVVWYGLIGELRKLTWIGWPVTLPITQYGGMMPSDAEFHFKKRPEITYISKRLTCEAQPLRRVRIVSRVFDGLHLVEFANVNHELVIRVTPGRRQEVKATVFEDNRGLESLVLQRYEVKSGRPHQKTSFSFSGSHLDQFIDFILSLRLLPFKAPIKTKVYHQQFDEQLSAFRQVREFLAANPGLLESIIENDLAERDIVALGYRKAQLEIFRQLLNDESYFKRKMHEWGKTTPEAVWQRFFEANDWIFGWGLNYVFCTSLDRKKLEQTIKGFDFAHWGKRADGLLKKANAISSFCLVEIKRHDTLLLASKEYRTGVWSPSEDLSGGIAQSHANVAEFMAAQPQLKYEGHNKSGDPTGETVYKVEPQCCLVIGNLEQFKVSNGVNEDKFLAFERHRAFTTQPTILTFDELFHRASWAISSKEKTAADAAASFADRLSDIAG
jgi:hypothetical protein